MGYQHRALLGMCEIDPMRIVRELLAAEIGVARPAMLLIRRQEPFLEPAACPRSRLPVVAGAGNRYTEAQCRLRMGVPVGNGLKGV